MKCSVFIATSADGYIATEDGGVEWLETAGRQAADLGEESDMGFSAFIAGVDCMIMGRRCMEKLASFNLTPEQWPYGNLRILVLSRTVEAPPAQLRGKVELYAGGIPALMSALESEGYQHAYIDGGTTITSFLNLGLIDELCLTRAPVLLGGGRPLFGAIDKRITLQHARARVFPNDFVQVQYAVRYA